MIEYYTVPGFSLFDDAPTHQPAREDEGDWHRGHRGHPGFDALTSGIPASSRLLGVTSPSAPEEGFNLYQPVGYSVLLLDQAAFHQLRSKSCLNGARTIIPMQGFTFNYFEYFLNFL